MSNSFNIDGPIINTDPSQNIPSSTTIDSKSLNNDPVSIIKSSSVYQNAAKIMANYPNWLAQLDAIVESARLSVQPGAFEGLTQKHATKVDTAVSNAMTEIGNLVSRFEQWQNSLPSTQKSQLNSAGIYDTSGIQGSSISEQSIAPNSGPSLSSDVLEPIMSVVSAVSSVSGNFVGLLGAFSNLGLGIGNLNLGKFNAKTQRGKTSYEILSDVIGKGGHYLDPYEIDFSTNRNTLNSSKFGMLSHAKAAADYYDAHDRYSIAGFRSEELTPIYQDIAGLQVEIYRQEYKMRKASSKFNTDYYTNKSGKASADAENAESRTRKARAEGDALIEKHFNALVSKWADKAAKGSFIHSILLTNLRTSGNLGVEDAVNTGINAVSKLIP